MENVKRACKYFGSDGCDNRAFSLGYLHGLAYPLVYDSEYQAVLMLVDYLLGRISMEG